MGTGEFSAGGNPAMDQHPIQERVQILLVASCYRNRDKLWPDGLLGLNADFTFFYRTGGLVEQSVEQNTKASCNWEACKRKKKIYKSCLWTYCLCLSNNSLQYFVIGCVGSPVKQADSRFWGCQLTRIFSDMNDFETPQGLPLLMHL